MKKAEFLSKVKDGRIKHVFPIDLGELVALDLEGLNDYADRQVLGDDLPCSLADLSYSIKGVEYEDDDGICSGTLLLEVDADVTDILEELEESDEGIDR
jgi:hypothetical protein